MRYLNLKVVLGILTYANAIYIRTINNLRILYALFIVFLVAIDGRLCFRFLCRREYKLM